MEARGEKIIGLCGGHRVGKTTLAQTFAQKHGIPFVQTDVSGVFTLIGKDPKLNYPIHQRIVIQEAILYALEQQFSHAQKAQKLWIADRTPIDLASYMMADVRRATFDHDPELALLVNGYVDRCIQATNRWFSTVILVQPGIPLVEASGKGPACPAYIEHLNLLQSGLMMNEKMLARHYIIPRRFTNLEDRIASVENAVHHSVDVTRRKSESRIEAGEFLH